MPALYLNHPRLRIGDDRNIQRESARLAASVAHVCHQLSTRSRNRPHDCSRHNSSSPEPEIDTLDFGVIHPWFASEIQKGPPVSDTSPSLKTIVCLVKRFLLLSLASTTAL